MGIIGHSNNRKQVWLVVYTYWNNLVIRSKWATVKLFVSNLVRGTICWVHFNANHLVTIQSCGPTMWRNFPSHTIHLSTPQGLQLLLYLYSMCRKFLDWPNSVRKLWNVENQENKRQSNGAIEADIRKSKRLQSDGGSLHTQQGQQIQRWCWLWKVSSLLTISWKSVC